MGSDDEPGEHRADERADLKGGGVEFKRRDRAEKSIIPRDEVISRVKGEMEAMVAEIQARIVEVPFDE